MAINGLKVNMTPSHPGDFIRTEVIEELGLNVTKAVAKIACNRNPGLRFTGWERNSLLFPPGNEFIPASTPSHGQPGVVQTPLEHAANRVARHSRPVEPALPFLHHGHLEVQHDQLDGAAHLEHPAVFAQFEREIISERTQDKMSAARRKGKWVGGQPVLAYDVALRGGRLIVNAEEAARVRAIYHLYLDHKALIPVVQEIGRWGWLTKRWTTRKGIERGGKPFTKNSLHRLLTNITCAGKVNYKGCLYEGEHDALYLLSEIARKNGGKVEARSWLPVGLRRDTYFGISLTSQEE